jgi:hypothetical protein
MGVSEYAGICRNVPARKRRGSKGRRVGARGLQLRRKWLISRIMLAGNQEKAAKCHSESGPLCAALCRLAKGTVPSPRSHVPSPNLGWFYAGRETEYAVLRDSLCGFTRHKNHDLPRNVAYCRIKPRIWAWGFFREVSAPRDLVSGNRAAWLPGCLVTWLLNSRNPSGKSHLVGRRAGAMNSGP